MPAHGDDPFRAHDVCGKDAKQTYGAVAHNDSGRTRLYIGRVSREPTGTENIGDREETMQQIV